MTITVLVPSTEDVNNIQIGSLALDCFGNYNKVVSIYGRGIDVNGSAYVGFYTEWGHSANISGSYKAGELVRTLPLCNKHNSAELDNLERRLKAEV